MGPVPPWRSGIADQTVRLARALARIGEPPLVVTFRRMYPGRLFPGATDRAPGGFPEDLEVRALLDGANPLTFRSAARVIAALSPELVVLPWWTAFFAAHDALFLSVLGAREPRAVKLLLCHNLVDHEGGHLKRRLSRAVLSRADRLVVQNRRSAEELSRSLPGHAVVVVRHPVEPRAVLPDRERARAQLGLPQDVPLFLFTGLLRKYKGWDVLLTAFAEVRRRHPDAVLALAGEPWGDARSLADGDPPQGVLLHLSYLSEEERELWLAACDAVVLPYRHATGSGIAADALAHGRPVIGSRVTGLLDVIEDGLSGLLVPPEDPQALAAALLRFIAEGLAARLSAGAVAARQRFSPEAHARQILEAAGLS